MVISMVNSKRVTALILIIVFAGSFVLWDQYRVNRDFDALRSLLIKTRNEALQNEITFTTKLSGIDVKILRGISGNVINALHVGQSVAVGVYHGNVTSLNPPCFNFIRTPVAGPATCHMDLAWI